MAPYLDVHKQPFKPEPMRVKGAGDYNDLIRTRLTAYTQTPAAGFMGSGGITWPLLPGVPSRSPS